MSLLGRAAPGAAFLALALLLSVDAHAERKSHSEMVSDAITRFVAPRLGELHDATAHLAAGIDNFCAKPDDTSLRAAIERAFARTVAAWGSVDFLRFGPITEQSRLERFFFWPDPRATTFKQLQALLSKREPALLEPGALRSQSVAVQGLGALELIVYDDKNALSGDGDGYRCAYAKAVGKNLDGMAAEIESGWTAQGGWRDRMLSPGSDNPYYKDAGETAREVVKAILTGLQIAQERNVVPLLEAAQAEPPKRVRLAFQRSGLYTRYIGSELASMSALFDATGLIGYVPPDKAWMKDFIPRAFETVTADSARLPVAAEAVPNDDATVSRLRKMRFSLNGLRQIIIRELAPGAELVLGFNELDGD